MSIEGPFPIPSRAATATGNSIMTADDAAAVLAVLGIDPNQSPDVNNSSVNAAIATNVDATRTALGATTSNAANTLVLRDAGGRTTINTASLTLSAASVNVNDGTVWFYENEGVKGTHRTGLGLGDSATRDVGTASGTVAAGNDERFPASPREPLRTVLAKVASYTMAESDNNSLHEVTTNGEIEVNLPNAIPAGTQVEVQIKGSGRVRFLAGGTSEIEGPVLHFGSGSVVTVTKKTATIWQVFSAFAGIRDDVLEHAGAVVLHEPVRIQKIDNLIRRLDGEDELNGHLGAEWDTLPDSLIDSLVDAWLFRRDNNFGSGATVRSFRGTHPATLAGNAEWRRTGVFVGDGAGNYINTPHAATLIPESITVAAWVAIGDIVGNRTVAGKFTLADRGWILRSAQSHGIEAIVYNTAGANTGKQYRVLFADTTGGNPRGRVAHMAFTFAAGSPDGTLKLYMDGVEQTVVEKTIDDDTPIVRASAVPLFFGNQDASATSGIGGVLQNLFIFDRALTAAEILNLKNATE